MYLDSLPTPMKVSCGPVPWGKIKSLLNRKSHQSSAKLSIQKESSLSVNWKYSRRLRLLNPRSSPSLLQSWKSRRSSESNLSLNCSKVSRFSARILMMVKKRMQTNYLLRSKPFNSWRWTVLHVWTQVDISIFFWTMGRSMPLRLVKMPSCCSNSCESAKESTMKAKS